MQLARRGECAPLWLPAKGVHRTASPTSGRRELTLTFQKEKASALLVPIPSLSAESVPTLQRSHVAISRDETNPFVQLVFLFSRVYEFQQQSDWASERSRHPARVFSLVAKEIVHLVLPQRVPQPLAFLQASVLQETFSRGTWICVALVSPIRQKALQKAAAFGLKFEIFFPAQRLLPVHAFSL
jgi:hypothetical protein